MAVPIPNVSVTSSDQIPLFLSNLFIIQVLKFFAYTKESVVESRLENYRIRKVHIFYYLVDKSIMIVEPKQVDSGVPQGAFFK